MTSAVDRVGTRQPTVEQFVGQLVPEIQRALPRGMDGDRIARLALTVVRKDRNLAQCNPYSFAGALLTAAALGLEVGTGEAHLVAYKGECTFIPDFKGLAKLFYQHPLARHLCAEVVYEHDQFDYARGLDPFLVHKPAKGDRGEIVAYYAAASLSTGAKDFVVLTPEECKALRGGKVGPDPRFRGGDPMHWMERKTALKQLLKLMPKSTELQRAIDADEKTGTELRHDLTPDVPALPEGSSVDPGTGEVVEGVLDETGGADPATDAPLDDPAAVDWPDAETAKPGSGGRRS